ncbi:biotin--[acetyl-CoA-carboxylase] ligase [Legionella longbeachae]|uniref:Bifunctional ligase/repressor BirA n=1 Tax=Legionella longbeachae serogroup 1 (strain NSW150) TaxID=661367 RepID=D3HJ76_LEGLN|nr:biotin--[acetyl-CoA-carboxylase] ligase [Legionella longbeachae]VEE02965.1 biotin-[acetylCoA carboxylase] holoenzyme synthetase and biotin operon repressor [Legionella oakridgensis]HBD7398644.1 biotin--[acetyl-CoA-carboxylase] ligase [Legionella pneumophila]ARB90802.1 biotin--[acetyl-CoA-carboxylase] ligase [Legionella longbeachae]ARM32773.1 biotin--[acetyl-CoA-carboxylase] ligase [Legionella longbeachae]EEZ94433.1 biotin operon repressor/biotin-(acetyl-CoA-carboxylase) synthetase BirA [Leg
MHFTSSQLTLLQLLGDGCCHSGSELGAVLGITRSAIWKQINQLIASGIPIKRLPNQGYQLPNQLILLDKKQINEYFLLEKLATPFNLHLFTSIDSTNRYLKELPTSNAVDICCAEIQTHGRGRFGRQWHSPFGENIYCSSRWNLNYDLTKLSGLSLVTSLAVLATLDELQLSTNIKIKWPNDILWNDKKLCGSLIEIITESNSTIQVIIGIGLNVNSDTQKHPLPDKPWCSLYEITQQYFDRNFLIAKLIAHLERYLIHFFHNDLSCFMHEWDKSDYLFGKTIKVTQSLNTLTGIACGINQLGQLILQDESGQKLYLSSGDTSLHNQHSL